MVQRLKHRHSQCKGNQHGADIDREKHRYLTLGTTVTITAMWG
jgi:hypothetical protein